VSNYQFQWSFKEKSLSQFWLEVKKEYPEVVNALVTSLLPSGSMYLGKKPSCYGSYKKYIEKLPSTGVRFGTCY
jgi:hypothetical protein